MSRILPYPPPVKSLGAKTNHLPNIQGSADRQALQNGPETGIFTGNPDPKPARKIDVILTPSDGESGPKRPFSGPPEEPFRRPFCGFLGPTSGANAVDNAAYSAASASIDFGLADDIMKSLIRGTISERKREPLKTP